ncbi:MULTISPECIES: hypothetical protein [unclassified Arcicella]|uniref:hypothetical protein n=1 Tax=unclassified Arcicella TaxID=2644986 RepID=UPI0028607923|nr:MULTISPECIES: hypothetical protein [unclassified Arcicella]MDR6561971.1 hypothetical protein [Arcicella sp. BE51]MDR6811842.1 hypothetical protein [Arcicella sp. BE140]MDR6822872.1 hypothetical protein [Arcicella sp. BE139]
MAKKDFMNIMKEKTSDLRPSLLSSEENIKSQIVVLDQLRDLIPPLTVDELNQLELNILKHGVKDPLSIWETTAAIAQIDDSNTPVFVLIDGHNRYDICKKNRLDYRINLLKFASLDEVKDYMIDFQLGRRNLTPEQASYLRGLRYLQQKSMRGGDKFSNEGQQDVSIALATEYGVSSRTIKRDGEFASGLNKLSTDLKQEILTGKQKLPKSTINAISKLETTSPLESIEEINNQLSKINHPSPEKQLSPQVVKLQSEIREIAKGSLNKSDCESILNRINQLLDIL